jgi:Calx-beta domain
MGTVRMWYRWIGRGSKSARKGVSGRNRRSPLLWEMFEPRILLSEVVDGTTLSIDDIVVTRSSTATVDAVFTVTVGNPSIEFIVSVDYGTEDGTAVANVDYTPQSGTLDFDPDLPPTLPITIPVLSRQFIPSNEKFENFFVNLSNPQFATIIKGQGIATIDNSNVPGAVQFASPSYEVNQDQGPASIDMSRFGGFADGVSVQYATVGGGTAIPNVDYVPTSGTVTFGQDQMLTSFPITILPNPLLGEDRTINLQLSNPGGGGFLGQQTTAVLTIHPVNNLIVLNTNDQGFGSLRQVIETANSLPGPNRIIFQIPGTAPFTITPASPLPTVTDPVTIDATTQPGYAGLPIVEINGSNAGSGGGGGGGGGEGPVAAAAVADPIYGLILDAGNTTVLGLVINRFSGSAILIEDAGGNVLQNDYFGTDVTGTQALPNALDGVTIFNSPNNAVGGSSVSGRNLISGNGLVGVRIVGASSTGNVVLNNLIGTDVTGTHAVPNGFDGVFIDNAPGNTIGGLGNVISGNGQIGVQIFGPGSSGNMVLGNLIGTDMTGTLPLGNGFDGVWLNGAPNNTIGSTSASERNVISANVFTGVRITGAGASGNVVRGNLIGTDITGTRALGNGFDGIFINNAPNNVIGGTSAGSGNVASGNGSVGLQIFGAGASNNLVQGNFFGTDLTGTQAVPNTFDGVFINRAPNNVIGGPIPGARNLMSGNGSSGLQLFRPGANGNIIQNNYIGANINGQPTLGNAFGLFINGAPNNTIGGAGSNESNLIIGNRIANVIQGFGLDNSAASAMHHRNHPNQWPVSAPDSPSAPSRTQVMRAALRAARRPRRLRIGG